MIVGIDLGTTNSLIAYFDGEQSKIIPNRLGKNLTPSVVSIDEEGNIYVGETAKERMLLYPDTAASVFKRDMGSNKKYNLADKSYSPQELSSFILRALKEDAESYLGEEITEAVISVPAYFNDARRKATKEAGELAGLKVERIISEPTAAAIAYGLYETNKDSKFLVFDLGGGTFDVSILELFGNILEVRAVAGDNFLGGEDFTKVLEDMFFEHFFDLDRELLDEKTLSHIHKQADECKINFENNRTSVMKCNIDGKVHEFKVDIDKYEEACEELLEKIRQPIKKSITDAHIKVSDIDKVVLVGGSTKLSIVRKFVGKLFRSIPDVQVDPDQAIALGAAIQAAMKERCAAVKEVILTDVCPFTLGTEVVVERENNRFENGHFCPIIERNTVIPASRTERLYTVHDNQTKIRVNVLQGESRFAENNLSLGEICVEVPAAKAGVEAVDVTYTYDINSILEVQVIVLSTGKVVKEIIKSQYTKLTDEEIKARMEEIAYLKIHPRDQEANKLLLLRGERLYEESLGNIRFKINHELEEFEKVLYTRDNAKIEEARKKFEEFLEEFDTPF